MKLKRTLAGLATSATLVGGTALVAMPALAQDDSSDDTINDTTGATGAPSFRGRGEERLTGIAETLGIDASALRERLAAGDTIADIAAEQGVAIDDVVDAMVADIESRLDAAVADERLTAEEAAEKLAEVETHVEQLVNGQISFPGRHGHHRGGFHLHLSTVAETLGIDIGELQGRLEAGDSLADIASEQDVTVDQLRAAMLAPAIERLDEAVANGDLTQDEADEKLAEVSERIDAAIDGELPAKGPGFGRGPGHHAGEASGAESAVPQSDTGVSGDAAAAEAAIA